MKLKSLVLKGFKSFANETRIQFPEAVTGVVGPNGSGKSNIVDAIRWVLGEQSNRELRLDQMANVIFNGAKNKKPAGLAQVTLEFENDRSVIPTEYSTVSISRLLYRSGESDYRLNDIPCRLKDISNLLIDTGISAESYAIISLGMVDDILLDKENSRRRMIEQAAGVSKYKIRKRETMTKLKSTAEDLDRVEDLLHEINKNLESLEKQAKRAQKYLELKAQYKQNSIDLFAAKADIKRNEYKGLEKILAEMELDLQQLESGIHLKEALLEKMRFENIDDEKLVSERQKALNAFVGELRNKENDQKVAEQKRQYILSTDPALSDELVKYDQRLVAINASLEVWNESVPIESQNVSILENELTLAESNWAQLNAKSRGIQAEYEGSVKKLNELRAKAGEGDRDISILRNQNSFFAEEISRSKDEIQRRSEDLNDLTKHTNTIEEEQSKVAAQLNIIQELENHRLDDLEKSKSAAEQLKNQISELQRKLDSDQNEYNLTKSMVENLEGFPESIQFLSKQKGWKEHVPLLSDIIYTDEKFRIQIEGFLEPYLNYYVVETWEDAARAITLLSEAQKGRANFFILESLKKFDFKPKLLPEFTHALEIIQVEPAYTKLAHYLLHDVWIYLGKEPNPTIGDDIQLIHIQLGYIRRKYSGHGGSIGLFEGKKLGRKKNLEILESTIKSLQKQREQRASLLRLENENIAKLIEANHSKQLLEITNRNNQLLAELAAARAKVQSLNAISFDHLTRESQLTATINQNSAILETKELGLKTIVLEIQELESKNNAQSDVIRTLQRELSEATGMLNQRKILLIQQQNKVQTLEREKDFASRQMSELEGRKIVVETKLKSNKLELDRLSEELNSLRLIIEEKYESKKALENQLTGVEQDYFKKKEQISQQEVALRDLRRNLGQKQGETQKHKENLGEVKHALQSIAERLQVEFSLNINEILKQNGSKDLVDIDGLEREVFKLRNRLDGFGEVNPLALETYEEMKNRYDEITLQKDDILKAKDNLIETIREIEKTATEQFMTAFEKIRVNFIRVFRSLFTEDDACDIILENPEFPLEAGIQIVAKPKGKKPQSLNQLSGGEKTLTAIALLFALYLLKPAPFCIFDEVDAPLDDANIQKFNNIVKEFSKESQFIVVTHNKATMASVDIIYGVYMEEAGISALSAVDFRAYDHDGNTIKA